MDTIENKDNKRKISPWLLKALKFIDDFMNNGIYPYFSQGIVAIGIIVLAAFALLITMPVASYPNGLAGVIGTYYALICTQNGYCDFGSLNGSLAGAIIIVTTILEVFHMFLFTHRSIGLGFDEDENSIETIEKLTCIQEDLNAIKIEIDKRL
jgi:hypothetical protein